MSIYLARQAQSGREAAPPSLNDPGDRQQILHAAGWFRLFAGNTTPPGSEHPLVPANLSLDVRSGLIPMKPPLLPLEDEALSAAARHRNKDNGRQRFTPE
jgi:hypothetical protein